MLQFYLSVIDDNSNDGKFIRIYNAYEDRVFSIAYGFTNDFHDAEDASQSAFFSIARNIDKISVEDEQKTKIYVYKSVKSACFDIIRKRKRSPQTVSIDAFFNVSSDDDLSLSLEKSETLEDLIKIIKSMPETYRDVLTYYYLGECSISEISNLLHRPIATVKSQFNRGNKILQQRIREADIHE